LLANFGNGMARFIVERGHHQPVRIEGLCARHLSRIVDVAGLKGDRIEALDAVLLEQLRKDRLAVEARDRVLRIHEDHDPFDGGGPLLLERDIDERPIDVLRR
jgi:hypothetical protein